MSFDNNCVSGTLAKFNLEIKLFKVVFLLRNNPCWVFSLRLGSFFTLTNFSIWNLFFFDLFLYHFLLGFLPLVFLALFFPIFFRGFEAFFFKSVLQFCHFFNYVLVPSVTSPPNGIISGVPVGMLVDKLVNTARFLLFPNLATLSMGEYLKTFLTGENDTRFDIIILINKWDDDNIFLYDFSYKLNHSSHTFFISKHGSRKTKTPSSHSRNKPNHRRSHATLWKDRRKLASYQRNERKHRQMDNTIQPNQQDDVQLHHHTQDSRELSPKTTEQTAKQSAKRLKKL